MKLFITCGTALEEVLQDELKDLGYPNTSPGFRGVYLEVSSWKDIYKINYASRIASRVLLVLKQFRCYDARSLYKAVKEIDWMPYFKGDETIAIDSNVDHREIRNSLFASQVVKDGVCDQLVDRTGRRPSVRTLSPDVQLNLFIRNQEAILSFDTSGDPLHKRGYRTEGGEAPLRENLAAALLRLAGYSGEDRLIDPCCGSGTFLIEACGIASKTPAGILRHKWGFTQHPEFDTKEWEEVKASLDQERIPLKKDHFFGIELNKNAYRISLSHFKSLGLAPFVQLVQGPFQDFEPKIKPNFLITNPPYGLRIDEEAQLVPLYRDLGHFMKRKMEIPGKGCILTGSLALSKEVGLSANQKNVVDNGGIEARFLQFDLYHAPSTNDQ